jgi:integrase
MNKKPSSLTDTAIRQAKPRAKQYKLSDGKGLYLLVTVKGHKWWRFNYRFNGKRKTLSMGVYPDVTLKQARVRRDEARSRVAEGIDPGVLRKINKVAKEDSFEAVALEWHSNKRAKWSEGHHAKIYRRLEKDLNPWLGSRQINEITAPELLAVLRKIEARGAVELAHRARVTVGQIFRYAIATGRAERDIAADLRDALQARKERHHPSITDPKAIGELLRIIHGYEGDHVTRCALRLAPLVFVRPGELRHAEWEEIDIDAASWVIPAEKMKMKSKHLIPLSLQARAILRELEPLTGRGHYVFPGARSVSRPMSENTVNAALRRLGYTKDQMTGHGFRSMASTRLNESQKWRPDAIERQLAHGERNKVRGAYNSAEHLEERKKMMQWWADYLDCLTSGRSEDECNALN